ncbi:MAG: DNA-binding protein [Rhodospirillaceae bacterium]|nr:DNA-binding protein [Rhodospirillaceae bacterium]|tara:strand:- start:13952 stop:14587 length:636 start_codon:yes stop_codon:yes gene_type:complete
MDTLIRNLGLDLAIKQDPKKDKSSLRRCLVSRRTMNKNEMVRFVIDPKGVVVPDIGSKLPGRGLWVEANRESVTSAVDQNIFTTTASKVTSIPNDLVGKVEKKLMERSINWLGLARRAGFFIIGQEKVRSKIDLGVLAILIQAFDGSEEELKKMRTSAKNIACVKIFSSQEISNVMGHSNVIHGALLKSKFVIPFMADVARLAGFRSIKNS